MTRTFLASSLMLLSSITFAQKNIVPNLFEDLSPSSLSSQQKNNIRATHFRLVKTVLNQLYEALENVPQRDGLKPGIETQIALPLPDGTNKLYQVVENNALHPELNAKFPNIKTYDAYGITDPSEFVKLDLTAQGFHAMILKPGHSPVFIDPLKKGNTNYYIVYSKKNFVSSNHLKCDVQGQTQLQPAVSSRRFANYNPCQLKKYRLAMAATAQYTQYQGGTVADALNAQATTINRVNGVYETDMAITMQLIADNNLIIYTNPNTQPYTHGNPGKMIDENQSNVNQVIGAANYDIGHVVDTAGSGLAAVASVCNNTEKARGVTGRNNPVGDPFDIDYVAHEMGHQFGANHVQNNDCNRNDATAVEPGSGSTIMGYAGICAPNVQKNSDAYFNGISLQEMGTFVSSPSHTCAVTTPISRAPIITRTNGGITIPAQTPFALSALANKNGSQGMLTYTWEQMDNEISPQPPISNALGGPNFRSFSPKTSSTRYFPNLNALSHNGPFTWEVLPSVSRKMNFRVSVRSNTPGGACNAYTDTTITTSATAGPFIVTAPAYEGIHWTGLSTQTITWDVANTNFYPVNTFQVNLYLSTDGGQTYPHPLLLNTANNGAQHICVPNLNTNTARIMVQASNGTFFNISPHNLTITAVPPRAPQLNSADRNRMHPQKAFILYADCIPISKTVYKINGLPGATVKLDMKNQRFIIENILTPKRVPNVTITATDEYNVSRTSNPITIPSIL